MRIGCSLFDFARNEWTKAVIDYWKNEIANDILYRKSKRIQISLWYFYIKDAIKYGWITIKNEILICKVWFEYQDSITYYPIIEKLFKDRLSLNKRIHRRKL